MHRKVIAPGRGARAPSMLVLCWLCGCGGQADVAGADQPTSHAGTSASASGSTGIGGSTDAQGGDAGSTAGAPTNEASASGGAGAASRIDPTVCAQFAPLWHSRATATSADCDFCLEYGVCTWPGSDSCVPGSNCVDRHCSTLQDGAALCSCMEGCFSVELRACDDRWSAFMTCATSACRNACQLD